MSPDVDRLHRMLEELQTYRAELEQQNAELVVAQVALEGSRAEFARLFDFSPIGVALLDGHNRVERANPALARLVGRGRHFMVGKSLVQFVAPEHHPELMTHLVGARFASVATPIRVTLAGEPGHGPRICQCVSRRLGDARDQVVVALTDVTAEEQLARQLEEREAHYRALFTGSRDGLIAYDPDSGRIIDANPAALALLGVQAPLTGQGLERVLGAAATTVDGDVLRVLAGDAVAPHEICPGLATNDRPRWFEVQVSAVPDGRRRWVLINLRDVSVRRQQAEANLALEARLAQMDRLEAVGKLAGGLAHDMNNLLAVIVGLASALRDGGGLDRGVLSDLDDMLFAAGQAREITDSLLAFARRGRGQPEPVEVHAIFDAVQALTSRRAETSAVASLEVEPGLSWWIAADRGALVRAVFNLVLNAQAASRPDQRIRLRAQRVPYAEVMAPEPVVSPPEWAVLIEVIDQGHGMPPEVLQHALDPYFTTRPQGEGTGLGLPMVYGTARSHGGWLELESELGAGTLARLVLPAIPTPPAIVPGAPVPRRAFEGRCLLADDDAPVRAVTERLLRRLGFEVEAVEGGAEAIEAYAARPDFCLVVLDVRMPQVDGVAAATAIRERAPEAPILLCSAWPEASLGEAVGPKVGFLAKPFTPDELAARLSELLG